MDISGYLLLFTAFAPDFKADFVEYSSLLSHDTNNYRQFTGKVDGCIYLSMLNEVRDNISARGVEDIKNKK